MFNHLFCPLEKVSCHLQTQSLYDIVPHVVRLCAPLTTFNPLQMLFRSCAWQYSFPSGTAPMHVLTFFVNCIALTVGSVSSLYLLFEVSNKVELTKLANNCLPFSSLRIFFNSRVSKLSFGSLGENLKNEYRYFLPHSFFFVFIFFWNHNLYHWSRNLIQY